MYYASITPEESHDYNYESLEKILEECLSAMSFHLSEKQQVFVVKLIVLLVVEVIGLR